MERIAAISQQLTGKALFDHLTLAPPDPILGTTLAFKKDTDPKKINLGVGAYRTEQGKPYIFKSVQKAEQFILENPSQYNHEYLPIDGYAPFVKSAQKLAFGDAQALREGRIFSSQVLSGTGGLRVGFAFLNKYIKAKVYIPNPTWGNHQAIIKSAGFEFDYYPYWDAKTRGLNFTGMMNTLETCPAGSIILLHPCAHNPTGVDPTKAQWEKILEVAISRNLICFFDSAYQGFATGDFNLDGWTVRRFLEAGVNLILTQSFAKNFGLYGERVGAIHFVCSSKDEATRALSQFKLVPRPMYSNPPCHGAFIVDKIVSDPALWKEYLAEIEAVSGRITEMRSLLLAELKRLNVAGDWSHIVNQIGMFSFTGLTAAQCEVLIKKWHIYLLKSGRISMAGLNKSNYKHFAAGVADVVANVK